MTAAGQGRAPHAPLEPLTKALERGPVPLSQAVKIVDRLCEILSGIHGAGQIHGAIHPGAVRFHHLGNTLSVVLDPADAPPPGYTAPEVARGGVATARTDIYAVGLLLHHVITGQPVFAGATHEEVLRQQIEEAPASLVANALQDVPPELDALVQKLLTKAPGRRPKTIDAVRATLQNLELDSTIMGVRLAEMQKVAKDLGAVPVQERSEAEAPTRVQEPPTVDDAEPPDDRPAISTFGAVPGDDVDPFADTFIRDRSAFNLDDEDTQMTLPPVRKPFPVETSAIPGSIDPAEAPVPRTNPLPEPAAKPMSTAVAVLIGVGVFIVTLVTILWVAG